METPITDIVSFTTPLVTWFVTVKGDCIQVKPLIPIFYSKLHTLDRKLKVFKEINSTLNTSERMLYSSERSLEFENVLFGNELNAWNGTYFIAPVDGIYSFTLQISLANANRAFRLNVSINDEVDGLEKLQENSSYGSTASSQGHTHTYVVERLLHVADTLTFRDIYRYSSIGDHNDYTKYKCKTNSVEHSCTYVTGRMIKKL